MTQLPHTMKIISKRPGFMVQDHDTFNSWGNCWGYVFARRDAAAEWAWHCHQFKVGQRMMMRDPSEFGKVISGPDSRA